ncbi:MAG: polyamine aminopropyltransferase [Bacteroidetes bacterium]|nr:polyamine aminopropyltransferase [Bacteroidota bacterium]
MKNPSRKVPILLTSVFIIAVCGILYELLISSISSYFQGSSILHFSIVIGLFLSFMGVGSFISRYIQSNLLNWFIIFEILLSIIGGLSTFVLYFAFSLTPYFYGFAFILIALLGTMIGLEIPILTRIVREHESLKDAMAKVLSFDYLGSLLASVIFPLVLLPSLGLMRTGFIIGVLNLSVAILNIYLFRADLPSPRQLLIICWSVLVILGSGFVYSFEINTFFEQFLYRDQVMLSKQSAYQQIVVTKWNQDIRLFIDGNIQFSSMDEHRYHEPLVHLPMLLAQSRENILILGGGDGLAAREVLKYPEVKKIDLVDLDPAITDLGKKHPIFTQLNQNALNSNKVHIFNQDGYKFVEESSDFYDVIIIDLPDPNNISLSKLYSQEFYKLLQKRISVGGTMITQSTSPYYAPKAFWCIHRTIEGVFPACLPINVFVPSFGQWGFNIAIQQPFPSEKITENETNIKKWAIEKLEKQVENQQKNIDFKHLNKEIIYALFTFDEEGKEMEVETNRLDNQILARYYESSWEQWR